MKCKNCGNILENDVMFCHLCGSGDLEPLNKPVKMCVNNQVNIQVNNQDVNQDNLNNNIYQNINNENKVKNKKNNKIFGWIYITLSFISIIVLMVLFFKTGIDTKVNGDYDGATSEEFKTYMEENDYTITDLSNTNSSYSYADAYYVARKNNNSYSVIYIYSENDDVMIDNSYNNIKNSIIKSESSLSTQKKEISTSNFSKYSSVTNNDYKIVAKTNNTIMYSTVNNRYKERIDKIFNDLGYSYTFYSSLGNSIIYLLLMILIITLLSIVSLWKIFKKAGRKGIYSLIPFYNMYCLSDMLIGNGWFFLISLIPIVNLIFIIFLYYKLGKMFGKNNCFIIGLIFLPLLFMALLAFDNSDYLGIKRI